MEKLRKYALPVVKLSLNEVVNTRTSKVLTVLLKLTSLFHSSLVNSRVLDDGGSSNDPLTSIHSLDRQHSSLAMLEISSILIAYHLDSLNSIEDLAPFLAPSVAIARLFSFTDGIQWLSDT